MKRHHWTGSVALLATVLVTAAGLAAWKNDSLARAAAAAAAEPEPMESVSVAVAASEQTLRTTTAIGTVRAIRSVTLRNEVPGTIDRVTLTPGRIVEAGTVLVTLETRVEQAELQAQSAKAALAETQLRRLEQAIAQRAAAALDVERARAERDMALAEVARIEAVIARKTLRAPFRARIGMADVHPGQFLASGAELTTLQGVDDAVHIDFKVPQPVVVALRTGQHVEIQTDAGGAVLLAEVVAVDARIDPLTRNAEVRARLEDPAAPAPGASVRVRVPLGAPREVVTVPAPALRRGPAGDHVFALEHDANGHLRARQKNVRTGPTENGRATILSGLSAGDRVAVAGSFKLRDGVLVNVAAHEPARDSENQ